MRVLSVVGARPQFIKAAPVSRALRRLHEEILVHTGQHYDQTMSEIFFRDLDLPAPDYHLGIGSAGHGAQTAAMLVALEALFLETQPHVVLVFGDTNSTLAGALAACKLAIPVAHIEAGLRSWNRAMPEEHNRVLTDHCSELLFCPTATAVCNLRREGLERRAHLTGDTMLDALLHYAPAANARSGLLARLAIEPGQYLLATLHRPSNVDDPSTLRALLDTLDAAERPVVLPLHPRTRRRMQEHDIAPSSGHLRLIEPLGYLDMLMLARHARVILTDSGGVQKEAFFLRVPCITLRTETEWVETVETGWNRIAGTTPANILAALDDAVAPAAPQPALFGTGHAAAAIVAVLERELAAPRSAA